MLQVQLTGSHLKVAEDSSPELFALVREAATTGVGFDGRSDGLLPLHGRR